MTIVVRMQMPPKRGPVPFPSPEMRKAVAGCTADGPSKIDHLAELIDAEATPSSPLHQASRRLQKRFGLSESIATVTAISAGLAMREVLS